MKLDIQWKLILNIHKNAMAWIMYLIVGKIGKCVSVQLSKQNKTIEVNKNRKIIDAEITLNFGLFPGMKNMIPNIIIVYLDAMIKGTKFSRYGPVAAKKIFGISNEESINP